MCLLTLNCKSYLQTLGNLNLIQSLLATSPLPPLDLLHLRNSDGSIPIIQLCPQLQNQTSFREWAHLLPSVGTHNHMSLSKTILKYIQCSSFTFLHFLSYQILFNIELQKSKNFDEKILNRASRGRPGITTAEGQESTQGESQGTGSMAHFTRQAALALSLHH